MKLSENLVPVAPLAKAVEECGLSASEICRNLGWVRDCGKSDTSRLRRRLGLLQATSVKGTKVYRGYQRRITYDLALRIAKAAHIDPVDVGL